MDPGFFFFIAEHRMTLYACLNVYQEEALLPDCLRSIRTVLPQAKIVLIDGAYASWVRHVRIEAAVELSLGNTGIGNDMLARFVSAESTDRTIEIAKSFDVEHIVMPKTQCMCGGKKFDYGYYEKGAYLPWPTEWEKRNRFFEFGKNGDYYFIVDGDERLRGTLPELKEDHYNVMLQRDDEMGAYPVQRVFKHQPGIKMEGAHMAVWVDSPEGPRLLRRLDRKDKQGNVIEKSGAHLLQGITIDHLFNERGSTDQVRHMAKGAYYRHGLSKEEEGFRQKFDV